MPPRRAPSASFLLDLFAQLFSARARLDAGRCCAYNGFLGLLLLGGALALRLSGPPDPLGGGGFAVVGPDDFSRPRRFQHFAIEHAAHSLVNSEAGAVSSIVNLSGERL